MTDTPITIAERLKQHRNATTTETVDRLAKAQQLDADRAGTLPAGTRVLDLDTGHRGSIIDRPATEAARPGLVWVQLDAGDVVARVRARVFVRPTPPSA